MTKKLTMICNGMKIKLKLKSLGNKKKRKEANKSKGDNNMYSKSGIKFKIESSDKSVMEKENDVEKFESIYALLDSTAWAEYRDSHDTTDDLDSSSSSYIHSDLECGNIIKNYQYKKEFPYWT